MKFTTKDFFGNWITFDEDINNNVIHNFSDLLQYIVVAFATAFKILLGFAALIGIMAALLAISAAL